MIKLVFKGHNMLSKVGMKGIDSQFCIDVKWYEKNVEEIKIERKEGAETFSGVIYTYIQCIL